MNRRHHAISLLDAAADSPNLARLLSLARESQQHLNLVLPLLPSGLKGAVKAGPVDGTDWCLIAADSAVAAKLRQMVPVLCARLRAENCDVRSIRVKVTKDA